MKKSVLYIIWACLYFLCAGLGHISEPAPVQAVALTLFALFFFVPGTILLIQALRKQDKKTLLQLRWISGLSLGLTFALLLANVFSVLGSELLGDVLYEFLIFVSVPMICSQYWFASLFLWACLLFATFPFKKNS